VNTLQPDARAIGTQPMLERRFLHECNGLGGEAAAAPLRITREQASDTLRAVPIAPSSHRYAAEREVAGGGFHSVLRDIRKNL
jgi:hypothetical protein